MKSKTGGGNKGRGMARSIAALQALEAVVAGGSCRSTLCLISSMSNPGRVEPRILSGLVKRVYRKDAEVAKERKAGTMGF